MSAYLEPIPNRSRFETALAPAALTASQTGSLVYLGDGDGPIVALVLLGDLPEEIGVAVSFQESDTGASWSNIAGSSVPDLASSDVAQHAFLRSRRFLRCQVTFTGDSPSVIVGVLVGQACKLF